MRVLNQSDIQYGNISDIMQQKRSFQNKDHSVTGDLILFRPVRCVIMLNSVKSKFDLIFHRRCSKKLFNVKEGHPKSLKNTSKI